MDRGTLAQQSPVDIVEYTFAGKGAGKGAGNSTPTFDYANATARIANTGDFVKVRYDNGTAIHINGDEYRLIEASFHSSDEHAAQGEHLAPETHPIHLDDWENISVMGVPYRLDKSNETLQAVIGNAPG